MTETENQFQQTFGKTETHDLYDNCESAIVSADETVMMAPKGETVTVMKFVPQSEPVSEYKTGMVKWDSDKEQTDVHVFYGDDPRNDTDGVMVNTAKLQQLSTVTGLSVETLAKRAKKYRYYPIVIPTERYNYIIAPVVNVSELQLDQ